MDRAQEAIAALRAAREASLRAAANPSAAVGPAGIPKTLWSKDSFQLIRSGLAQQVSRVQKLESFLLQEGTTRDGEDLAEKLQEESAQAIVQAEMMVQEAQVRESLAAPLAVNSSSSPPAQQVGPPSQAAVAPMEVQITESDSGEDHVILFGTGPISPWKSGSDSQELQEEVEVDSEELLTAMAIEEIITEGMDYKTQGWCGKLTKSVQVLGDQFLENWSNKDNKCEVIMHNYPTVARWTQGVRLQEVPLLYPITVVALPCLRQLECLEPLKNHISALCRVVRLVNPGGRVFFNTNIPNPRSAPVLGKRARDHNRMLFLFYLFYLLFTLPPLAQC